MNPIESTQSISVPLTIWHISDIHIRFGFYTDIMYAINRLTSMINKNINSKNLIVIAGDIFERRNRLDANDIICFKKILNQLSDCPIIIIPGNHDFIYNKNPDIVRDLISSELAHTTFTHIHHYPRSGIYNLDGFDNVEFHILSPIDNIIPDLLMEKQSKLRIAIMHEPVLGMRGTSKREILLTVEFLSKYDLVLAGDIHEPCFVNSNYRLLWIINSKNTW